ncbi:MAG: hypothetical protein IPG22_00065 [Acidobacteria bacterium]|nr:hypothetical protein [Acidobacteriota bacterium]
MFKSTIVLVLLAAFLFAMNQETPAQKSRLKSRRRRFVVKAVPPEISYTVSMSKPWTHLLEVEMKVKWAQMPEKAELKMPVWTPGSYLIREYARHVQNFSAKDASGNELTWAKSNKNTWAIDTKGAKEIVAKYLVYSNELTVRTNEVNDEHAFWNNSAALFFVKDHLAAPSTVKVNPYGNWRSQQAFRRSKPGKYVQGRKTTMFFMIRHLRLVISRNTSSMFRGKSHRFVITGEGNYDLKKLAVDTAKIVEESYKIFGELAYDNYTFIVNTRGGGGLEHFELNCSSDEPIRIQARRPLQGLSGPRCT